MARAGRVKVKNGALPSVVWIQVSELTPADYNPRFIKDAKFAQLKRNIESDPEFFAQRPCLVNRRDGCLVVYAGNMRLRAAMDLGWDQVPCIVSEISISLEKERNIKDNRQEGEWDWDSLANNFEIGTLVGWGFSEQELIGVFDGELETREDGGPGPLPEKPRTKRGQIFVMGGAFIG